MKDKTFEQHPSLKSYFKTSDGVGFFKAYDANTHAIKLEDKTVTEVKRPKSVPKQKKPTTTKAATN